MMKGGRGKCPSQRHSSRSFAQQCLQHSLRVPGLTRGREGSWEVVLAKVRGQTTAWQRRCGVQQESVATEGGQVRNPCGWRQPGAVKLTSCAVGAEAGKDALAAEVCWAGPCGTLCSSRGL